MKKITLPIALLAITAACAQTPSAIVPINMQGAYSSTSCSKARELLSAEQQAYVALESQQNAAVSGDAIGVLLIGVPVSSLTQSDVTGEIAASKGKQLALTARLTSC